MGVTVLLTYRKGRCISVRVSGGTHRINRYTDKVLARTSAQRLGCESK